VGWWVAADAIRDAASLVNADVINIHFGWELHVLEVLRLEGSFGGHHQMKFDVVTTQLTSHSQVEDKVLHPQ